MSRVLVPHIHSDRADVMKGAWIPDPSWLMADLAEVDLSDKMRSKQTNKHPRQKP